MFGPLVKGIGIAASPAGRRVIRTAIKVVRSDEGRKAIAEVRVAAHKAAASPHGQKLIDDARRIAVRAGKAAGSPENRERLRHAAHTLRERRK